MSPVEILPALNPEAIYAKSKQYVVRALRCKGEGDLNEYQLWASLALELLGKACLARKHPSLIANPTHQTSLFAASGINIGTDIKTIIAKTLFERLRILVTGFDHNVEKYCVNISERRNAELHSGELPFENMKLAAWEARYWHAAQLILHDMNLNLEGWLGVDRAKAPRELLEHAHQATIDAAKVRIEQAREKFSDQKKAVKENLLEEAKGKFPFHYRGVFDFSTDEEWMDECPACSGNAILAGDQVDEEILDEYDEENPWEETVEKYYVADSFFCPVCQLRLNSQAELEAGGLETSYSEVETREREYEPDYGND